MVCTNWSSTLVGMQSRAYLCGVKHLEYDMSQLFQLEMTFIGKISLQLALFSLLEKIGVGPSTSQKFAQPPQLKKFP